MKIALSLLAVVCYILYLIVMTKIHKRIKSKYKIYGPTDREDILNGLVLTIGWFGYHALFICIFLILGVWWFK